MAEETSLTTRKRGLAGGDEELFRGTASRNEARHMAAWKQVRATTAVVIVAVFAFAAYFAVVDAIVGRVIQKVFDMFTK